jgi:hypothetical protein
MRGRKSAKEARKKMRVAVEWPRCLPEKRARMKSTKSAAPSMVMSTVVVTMSLSVLRRSLDTVKLATSVAAGVVHPVLFSRSGKVAVKL